MVYNYKEVIENIKSDICYNQPMCSDGICKSTEENPCTIDITLECIEKQIPKKMVNNTEQEWLECPMCGRILIPYYANEGDHCKCGQAIDWGN